MLGIPDSKHEAWICQPFWPTELVLWSTHHYFHDGLGLSTDNSDEGEAQVNLEGVVDKFIDGFSRK